MNDFAIYIILVIILTVIILLMFVIGFREVYRQRKDRNIRFKTKK